MIPYIVIVGRSNVGKSVLFNKLTFSNRILTYNFFGLTKDKNYSLGNFSKYEYLLSDTPGINFISYNNNIYDIKYNINLIISNSDIIFFVVDGIKGVFYEDEFIANYLRETKKYICLIVNKIDNNNYNLNYLDFLKLKLGQPYIISAIHDYNIKNTINNILNFYCKNKNCFIKKFKKRTIQISIIGNSNTGKSSFINSLINKNQVITHNKYFITRDALYLDLKFKNYIFTLIDTYGLNIKNFILKKSIEKLSIIKTFYMILKSNVIIFFLDFFEKLFKNNFFIFNKLINYGLGVILVINKSDLLTLKKKIFFKKFIKKKLNFINFSYIIFISALKKINIKYVVNFIYRVYKTSIINISTYKLNKIILYFNNFLKFKKIFSIKLNYAHQGGKNPPLIIVNGLNLNKLNVYFNKILENLIRINFNLKGVPLRINYYY